MTTKRDYLDPNSFGVYVQFQADPNSIFIVKLLLGQGLKLYEDNGFIKEDEFLISSQKLDLDRYKSQDIEIARINSSDDECYSLLISAEKSDYIDPDYFWLTLKIIDNMKGTCYISNGIIDTAQMTTAITLLKTEINTNI